ncbi:MULTISPECIES: hypothetical protein [Hymenobacter]|uniref:Uncharacterized protein n=1 Tax=Hymenobacter mucosus TaxID=1411120 RepID=A0A238X3P1_9BACT|nr:MULTISPECIES: hypothetical protein [Hymenobacter]SNR53221.1 hypothetical protein SAMN06269173_103431 [Hymenobacter mucosus]
MKLTVLPLLMVWLSLMEISAQAQQTRKTTRKARSGAYARYDRSNRRDEENLKLAPGLRLNMPSPPTTDYMGRPLKKKTPKPASATTTLSAGTAPAKPAPAVRKKRR